MCEYIQLMLPNNLIIRQAENGDFERGHLDVLQQLNPTTLYITKDDYYKCMSERNFRGDTTIIALDTNSNRIVGSANGDLLIKWNHNCGTVLEIEDVIVDAAYRGRGIGTILVNKLIEHSKNIKCYKANLYCKTNNIEFYRKLGFNAYEQQMAYYIDVQAAIND